MKVNNTTIFMGDDTLHAYDREQASYDASHRKTIDGSALLAKFDPIEARKEEAKKKAMQIVGNVFANEMRLDDDLNTRSERIKLLQKDMDDANRVVRQMEDRRVALRDFYGVEADSQEEQDLKLLEKEIYYKMGGNDVQLSKEDMDRIHELKEKGLTEYQQRSLELLEQEEPYITTVYGAKKEIRVEHQIINAIKLERLKSHPMVDAEKQAEAIMDEASDELIRMITDEAKDHIDGEMEQEKEKAEEARDKEEEMQEKIDASKEKKERNEKLTEAVIEGVAELVSTASDVSAVQQEVKDMMSRMKLVEEDIKGAAVDKSV